MSVAAQQSPALPRIVLIDLSSIFHPAYRSNENGPLSVAFAATIDAVTRCAKKDPTALVAICLDSRRSWRKELVPSYKANREKLPNDFYGTLDRVKERLIADGFLLWESDGFEADDIIATATEEAVRRGHEVAICSADKDLMQLLRPGVKQFRTHDQSLWSVKEFKEKFGIEPSQFGDYLALVGDSSDNVKGCQGVGEKRATAMLQVNGDWAGIEKAALAKSFTPAITTALANFDYKTARLLVDLVKTVPIKFDDIYQRREQRPLVEFEDEPMNHSDLSSPRSLPAQSANTVTVPPGEEQSGQTRGQETVPTGARETQVRDEGGGATAPEAPPPGELPPPIALPTQLVEFKSQQERRIVPISAQFEKQLEPSDVKEALWMAAGLYNSRLYSKFESKEAIWAVMIRGREMGMPALAALDAFHVIEGKPSLTSNAIHTLAERLPECAYLRCIQSDEKSAEWETKHRGHPEPERLRYTIEEAVQAGLCTLEMAPKTAKPGEKDKRSNWDKRRANMLRKTARDNLIGMVYPSARALYSSEALGAEIDD